MTNVRVAFRAFQIGNWMAAGGKLTDLAGGSEIIERLTGAYLDALPEGAKPAEQRFDIRASARIEFVANQKTAQRFIRLWPLVMHDKAPGLSFGIGIFSLKADHETVARTLEADASLRLAPYRAGPLADRAQRTGNAAVQVQNNRDVPGSINENVDTQLQAMRKVGEALRPDPKSAWKELGDLQRKFEIDQAHFVSQADALAAGGSTRYLAYVHADGCGVGGFFELIKREHIDDLPKVSQALNNALVAAAKSAFNAIEVPSLFIRPVLLGGEDLTLILPADYGLSYAEAFLRAFQCETRERLGHWLPAEQKDVGLRAGAGIAYVHAHFPSESALHLAGGLCDWAKAQTDRQVSALAFHRVTTSGADEYKTIFSKEVQREEGEQKFWLTAGPYTLDRVPGFCTVSDIQALLGAAQSLPNGPLRETLSLAQLSRPAAEARFARLCEKSGDPRRGREAEAMGDFTKALAAMGFGTPEEPAIWADRDDKAITPLADLHALLSVEGKKHDESR